MATGSPYFTLERARGGYQAKFYGGNHELVWLTEIHPYKQGAERAIAFAKAYAASAPVYDRT